LKIKVENSERGLIVNGSSIVKVEREGDLYAVKVQKYNEKIVPKAKSRTVTAMLSKDAAEKLAVEIMDAYRRGDKVFYVKEV